MTEARGMFSTDDVRDVVTHKGGWNISLYMPVHSAGEETKQDAIRLKNIRKQAVEELVAAVTRY